MTDTNKQQQQLNDWPRSEKLDDEVVASVWWQYRRVSAQCTNHDQHENTPHVTCNTVLQLTSL